MTKEHGGPFRSFDEAVWWIVQSCTPAYIRGQLADWRKTYGDAWADKVRAVALPQWKKRNRGRG